MSPVETLTEKIFTAELKAKADACVALYESRRASLLMILRLVQDYHGYVSPEAQKAVAHYLGLPEVDVHEVVSFYTLFHTRPRAKTEFHICRSLSCSLMGSGEMTRCAREKLGLKPGQSASEDGHFSVDEVECLGACELAPMLQVNDGEFYGPLSPESMTQLIDDARQGKLEAYKKTHRMNAESR
ncbi:MAG: NAD(P)H-dependent oxidoreductase subunit E [Candidatus Omnitrophica bacterium]|nr:NAD(P)H-dependent oxidoreductase subunit E [Candidatus Omnitrophota bacterium]